MLHLQGCKQEYDYKHYNNSIADHQNCYQTMRMNFAILNTIVRAIRTIGQTCEKLLAHFMM